MEINKSRYDVVTDKNDKCVIIDGLLLLCNKTSNGIISVPLCSKIIAEFGLEELQDPTTNIPEQTSFCDAHLSPVEKEGIKGDSLNIQEDDLNIDDNPGKIWNSDNTLAFINIVSEHYNEFSISLKKKVWEKIAKKLSLVINRKITSMTCETKWKTLKRTYKSISISNQTSGQNRRFWEYFNAMHGILFNKPEVNPVATCSSLEGFQTKAGCIMSIAYSLMGKTLCASLPPFDNNESACAQQRIKVMKSRKRVACILLLLAVVFAACWLPYHIMSLLVNLAGTELDPNETVSVYLLLLGHANSALNPIIYCALSRNFRNSIKNLLKFKIRCRRRKTLNNWAVDSSASGFHPAPHLNKPLPLLKQSPNDFGISRRQSSQKTTKTCAV